MFVAQEQSVNLVVKTYYIYNDKNGKVSSKEIDFAIFKSDAEISSLINEYINKGYKLANLLTKECGTYFNLVKNNKNGFAIDEVEIEIIHDVKFNQWSNFNLQFFDQGENK